MMDYGWFQIISNQEENTFIARHKVDSNKKINTKICIASEYSLLEEEETEKSPFGR